MASTEIEILDPAATVDKNNKIAAGRAQNRRRFIAALGMTGAAAGVGLMSGCSTTSTSSIATTPSGTGQTSILAFLLNLQYLEATLYSYLATGGDLPSSVISGSGTITGAPAALAVGGTITQLGLDLLNETYYDELNHVIFLQSILGSGVVARPAINLAAFGAPTTANALSIGRLLEDVGVTACASALAGLSTSNAAYVAQILGAESFHAGALRLLSIQSSSPYINSGDGLDVPPYDPNSAALAAAGPAALGGFFASAGGAAASTNITEGLAYTRTTSQVLAVLYGTPTSSGLAIVPASAGTNSGGFFPKGVNGAINTI
ncbi:MAG: ferritin-like domain-containing protein [Terracidiphilus sp.]